MCVRYVFVMCGWCDVCLSDVCVLLFVDKCCWVFCLVECLGCLIVVFVVCDDCDVVFDVLCVCCGVWNCFGDCCE